LLWKRFVKVHAHKVYTTAATTTATSSSAAASSSSSAPASSSSAPAALIEIDDEVSTTTTTTPPPPPPPLTDHSTATVLEFKQFYHLFFILEDFSSRSNVSSSETLSPKSLLSLTLPAPQDLYDDDECIICMERKSQILLSCTHSFCEECLDNWKEKSDTCPMCRSLTPQQEDGWLIMKQTDPNRDIASYCAELLDKL